MMSTWLMIALMVFYAGIGVASVIERSWPRVLYCAAAIQISIAVLWMTGKR